MEVRLQKFLADAGVASRRSAEKLIEEGKVKVNGQIVKQLGTKVDPQVDVIEYNGKTIIVETQHVYYMLHKPVRYVTTASDEKGRKTVLDLLKVKERVFPIGRLDFLSSGLLILTNDGELTYKLTHPKHVVEKKYLVEVEPKVSKDKVAYLSKGVDLGIYKTSPCKIKLVKDEENTQVYEVTIHEGKNRQIRRMFEHIDTQVKRLKRIAIGELRLGKLPVGEFRPLTEQEIKYLKDL